MVTPKAVLSALGDWVEQATLVEFATPGDESSCA